MTDKALAIRQDDAPSLLNIIAEASQNPAVDVGKLSALLELQERVLGKQAEAAFNQAFGRLIPKLPRIKKGGRVEYPKDKKNPDGPKEKAFNFARWEDIDEIIRPLLLEEGFTLSFNTSPRQGDGGGIVVTGTLLHSSGHTRSASIPLALDSSGGKNNIQGMGSTFSYGKRYTTTALLNLVFEGEDDDGKRGGMSFISDAQVAELRGLLDATKTGEARFLETLTSEARNIEEVEARDFARLKNALLSKQQQQGRKG